MTLADRTITRQRRPRGGPLAVIIMVCMLTQTVAAQSAELTAATEAFERAQQSQVDATPDVPVWSVAIEAAELAVAEATTPQAQAAALRQLARTLQAVSWWVRANVTWTQLEDQQGGLTVDERAARAEVRTQLAYARFEEDDLPAARTFIEQALADAPTLLTARRLQARLDLEQDRRTDALRRLQALAREFPDDREIAHALGVVQERERWGLEASEAYRHALALGADGDWTAAEQAFMTAATAAADWGAPAAGVVEAALQAGDTDAAVTHVANLEQRFPNHPALRRLKQTVGHATQVGTQAALAYQAALEEYDAGNVGGAIERLTLLAGEQPSWAAPWAQVGQIHFNRSAWQDAADAFERALQRAPGDATLTFFAEQSRMLAGPNRP